MKSKILHLLILSISLLFLGFSSCNKSNDERYQKRLIEAKWLYYESNYTIKRVSCDDAKPIILDTNICFIEELTVDTTNIGDTLEIKLYTSLPNHPRCDPGGGMPVNYFGFYPTSDTVVYRANSYSEYKRRPEITGADSTKWEWAGFYSRQKQKKMFKEFIIKNQNKINSFLKEQAKKRGYIK